MLGEVGAPGGDELGAVPLVGRGGRGMAGGGDGKDPAEVLFLRSFDIEFERSARMLAFAFDNSFCASIN